MILYERSWLPEILYRPRSYSESCRFLCVSTKVLHRGCNRIGDVRMQTIRFPNWSETSSFRSWWCSLTWSRPIPTTFGLPGIPCCDSTRPVLFDLHSYAVHAATTTRALGRGYPCHPILERHTWSSHNVMCFLSDSCNRLVRLWLVWLSNNSTFSNMLDCSDWKFCYLMETTKTRYGVLILDWSRVPCND